MKTLLRRAMHSKYVHLCLGLLILYGVSFAITRTSRLEKIMDSLCGYSACDYDARIALEKEDIVGYEFYRERYRERLISLSEGLFEYRDKKQVQAFFLSHELLYDVWQERGGNSYILAEILEKGRHEAETPEKVSFDYYILGDKEIEPILEYRDGAGRRAFVSAGEEAIYIHKDSLRPTIGWYFDALWSRWESAGRGSVVPEPSNFYWDSLSECLYKDLHAVVDTAFKMRLYQGKDAVEKYFTEEGFKVFLPTLLAMGSSLAADRGSPLYRHHQYQKALLMGLAARPNFTMIHLCRGNPSPYMTEIWKEFEGHVSYVQRWIVLTNWPGEIAPAQISKAAKDILTNLEKSWE